MRNELEVAVTNTHGTRLAVVVRQAVCLFVIMQSLVRVSNCASACAEHFESCISVVLLPAQPCCLAEQLWLARLRMQAAELLCWLTRLMQPSSGTLQPKQVIFS